MEEQQSWSKIPGKILIPLKKSGSVEFHCDSFVTCATLVGIQPACLPTELHAATTP